MAIRVLKAVVQPFFAAIIAALKPASSLAAMAGLFALASAATTSIAAAATLLPAATYYEWVSANAGAGVPSGVVASSNAVGPLSINQSQSGNSIIATATTSNSPAPSVSAAVSTFQGCNCPPAPDGGAEARSTYSMEVIGAPGIVNVLITASGGALASPTTYDSTAGDSLSVSSSAPGSGIIYLTGNFNVTSQATSLFANTIYTVYLDAIVGGAGSAFVDPVFSVADPNYSIAFSDGIGNTLPSVSAIPEPPTWTMMLAGLVGIGFVAYLRRKPSISFAAVC